jgi:hypothetical protein
MRTTVGCLLLVLAVPVAARETPATTYHIPYRLTGTNHVLVRVRLNGKGPYNFILDTGAPALFVSTAVCRKLGVKAGRDNWGTFEQMDIEGGVRLRKVEGRVEDPFQLEGMNGLGLAGAELHGIIGYNVLARFRIVFDFTRDKMDWTALDYIPPRPEGLGGQGASTGMEAMGTVLKLLGGMLGKKAEPEITLRGFLGVALEDDADGVVVRAVLAQGPADAAGLRAGDRLTRFQDKAIRKAADVQRLAAKLGPDETAHLEIARGGERQALQLKTGRGF